MALDDTPLTPDWWLIRLGRALRARQPRLDLWWRYYSGDQPLPQGPRKAAQAYLDFQKMSRTNFCSFATDATVHRAVVMGVNGPDGTADEEAWGWWQLNRLDSRQRLVHRLALAQSVAYVMVGEHPDEPGRPLITPEHPRQVITEDDPETGETIAAAKFWYDTINRRGRANVYLADRVVRYATATRGPGPLPFVGRTTWELLGEDPHDLGEVPVVAFACRPDLGEEPEACFAKVLPIQDRINLGVLNRMTAERYSAFRQKYVTGHKFAKTIDPVTGLETVVQPFRPDPGGVWASEGENVKFGEFSQTDLLGYLKAHEADVRDLLILTHTPGYYYATDLINLSADTVTALDTNHVALVQGFQADWGESWEQVLGLAAAVAGSTADRTAAEVRWQDPRQLNPAVLADVATKLQAAGYPLSVIAEKTGESPQRIQAITAAGNAQSLLKAALTPAFQAHGQPAPPAPLPPGTGA